jgi:RNA polymerase sigma-70 factor, ECF subfamily
VQAALERGRPRFCEAGRIDDHRLSALVGRVARGDQQAFAGLYDELSSLVYGVARRVIHDPAHAEEVTQEVFVELWQQAGRYDRRRGSVRTWAVTIARRRAVDRVRSEQAHRDRHDHDARLAANPPSSPDEAAVDSELRSRAAAALDELSPVQREALELAYFGGLTHPEIAERLGVALGTAKTRLRDGVLRLRAAMDEIGGDDDAGAA